MSKYIGLVLSLCLMMSLVALSGCNTNSKIEEKAVEEVSGEEFGVEEIPVEAPLEEEVTEEEVAEEEKMGEEYGIWSATPMVVGKQCGGCGRMVSISSQVGQRCPHCGGIWGYQMYKYVNSLP